MKLRPKAPENAIYESFSDLIFATLVLFIVMIIGLALQVRQAEARAARVRQAGQLVYEGRRSGGANQSRVIFCTVPIDGERRVALVPESLSKWWTQRWVVGPDGELDRTPLYELAEHYLRFGDACFLSYEEHRGLAAGLSLALSSEPVSDWWVGQAYFVLRGLRSERPDHAWTADELTRAAGGAAFYGPGRDDEQLPPRVQELLQTWYVHARERWGPWHEYLRERFTPAGFGPKDGPALVRFHVDGEDVRIGKTVLGWDSVHCLFAALRAGRGFELQHVGAAGEAEVAPPQAFYEQVMMPTGFVDRLLTDVGERLLEQRRGG